MSHNPQNKTPFGAADSATARLMSPHPVWWQRGQRFVDVLNRITMPFPHWSFQVIWDQLSDTRAPRYYLQVHAHDDTCARTGEPYAWEGREWMLRDNMTDSEILRTGFLATRAAAEHELFERFKIDGKRPFDPHIDLTKLSSFAGEPGNTNQP